MNRAKATDRALDAIVYVVLLAMGAVTLLPFANVLAKSVSAEWAVISGRVGVWPIDFQLDTMRYVVTSPPFVRAFVVSLFLTAAGSLLSILVTAVTAYPLSKRQLPGMRGIMVAFVFTMLFSGGTIPNYLLIRQLGLMNSLWALILPALISVFNMLIVKSHFENLPESLEESARMDGARNMTVLFRILLPLSMPVLATIALFYAVYYWNDYYHPMLYINSATLKPLQLYLRDIVMDAETTQAGAARSADDMLNISPEGVRAATVVASTIPIVLVYPYLQKYFIKGVLIGSVKG